MNEIVKKRKENYNHRNSNQSQIINYDISISISESNLPHLSIGKELNDICFQKRNHPGCIILCSFIHLIIEH